MRLVFAEDVNMNIDILENIAYKIRSCIRTFVVNFQSKIAPENNKIIFQLPSDYKMEKTLTVTYFAERIV